MPGNVQVICLEAFLFSIGVIFSVPSSTAADRNRRLAPADFRKDLPVILMNNQPTPTPASRAKLIIFWMFRGF